MEIRFRDTRAEHAKTDLLVIPVRAKKLEEPHLRALNRLLKGNLPARSDKSNFTGAERSSLLYPSAGAIAAAQLLLIGLGGGETSSETWRKVGGRAHKEARSTGAEELAILFSPEKETEAAAGAVVEGVLLAGYQFSKYRSNTKS